MAILSESEARAILTKALSFSKADECQAVLNGGRSNNLRFARNTVSTSGSADTLGLSVLASVGQRSATATINEFDDASLAKVVARAEELARLSPVSPEYVPFVGLQSYLDPRAHFATTAGRTPDDRARDAAASIALCRQQQLTSAGFLTDASTFSAIANTRGLFGYQQRTAMDFSVTARTADGSGSGYGSADQNDSSKLDARAVTAFSASKAVLSREPRTLDPGKYTVILEPSAGGELVALMMGAMGARVADEGRSAFSKPGGGTLLGEKVVDERVSLMRDPLHADLPGAKWAGDGRALRRVNWIEGGVLRNLSYTRYWAQRKGLAEDAAPPAGGGMIMAGGSATTEELIGTVRRGVLVTRFFYIRAVDPQTLLYTGLTRDGTFLVENGRISHPIKNFRFNESPIAMLKNLEALGRPVRADGNIVPPMVVRDFTFSSLSDAI